MMSIRFINFKIVYHKFIIYLTFDVFLTMRGLFFIAKIVYSNYKALFPQLGQRYFHQLQSSFSAF